MLSIEGRSLTWIPALFLSQDSLLSEVWPSDTPVIACIIYTILFSNAWHMIELSRRPAVNQFETPLHELHPRRIRVIGSPLQIILSEKERLGQSHRLGAHQCISKPGGGS